MISEMGLLRTNVIPVISKSWGNSFSEVDSNKKSIAEHGWFPYNQNLLIHKQFRDTITMKDIETEKNVHWCHQLS